MTQKELLEELQKNLECDECQEIVIYLKNGTMFKLKPKSWERKKKAKVKFEFYFQRQLRYAR